MNNHTAEDAPSSNPVEKRESPSASDADRASATRRRVLVGVAGLGVAGTVVFGVMAITDNGGSIDEPDPELGEAETPEGTSNESEPVDVDPVIVEPVEQPTRETTADDADGENLPSSGTDDESVAAAASQNSLRELCASVQHSPPPGMEETAISGIWVRGRLGDGSEGWIYVEGSAFNGGIGVQTPVINGAFDGPLGITSYGEHPIDTFQFTPVGEEPVDLLPTMLEETGGHLPVGPEEGPLFDGECLDFEPVVEAST